MKASILNLFHTYTTLLPGGLRDCLDPTNSTDPTCVGGMAAVSAIIRLSKSRGDGPAFFRPTIDRESQFVQMHPEGWGVNRLISHDYFGWKSFMAPVSLFLDEDRLSKTALLTSDFRSMITNVDLTPTSVWSHFLDQILIDEETGTAWIHLDNDSQPRTASSIDSLVAALDYIAYVNTLNGCFQSNQTLFDEGSNVTCLMPAVYYSDKGVDLGNKLLKTALEHPYPPVLFSDSNGDHFEPELMNNKTLVLTLDEDTSILTNLRVTIDLDDWIITNFTLERIDLSDIPLDYIDDEYTQDMIYLRSLADQALANDPVVGTSGFMPFTRIDDWRMCMAGECIIGNLFTDAIRWVSDSDFAVLPSGGLRGEGWDAGDVRVSDIWGSLPFLNNICTGIMSGVSVFRLLNYSTSVATFESTYTPMGDRLLQMSGMKMTYNTKLEGSDAGRLIAVYVWDKVKEAYVPLERLKMYKFVTDNWMCDHFDPYPSLLKELTMDGEVNGVVDQSRPIQDIVGSYLLHLTDLGITYDTSFRGSHVNDTKANEPMAFVQTASSCLNNYYWKKEILTCEPCPGGKHVKFADDLISFLITKETSNLNLAGRNVLSNRELFNVTVAPKQIPGWLMLKDSAVDTSTMLQPGDSTAIEFDVDKSSLQKGTARSTVSFGVILDGEYPGCLTDLGITFDVVAEVRGEENYNHLGAIRAVGLSLMSLSMLGSLFFSIWTHKNRKKRVVQMSQPIFMHFICGGTFIMSSTIIPMSIDDGVASIHGCDIACMSVPWIFSIGFATTFSALFAKIWRIHTVMSRAMRFTRVVIRERDAMKWIILVFTLNVILLLSWTLIDPLQWKRQYINGDVTNSYGTCQADGNASDVFVGLLILVDGAALFAALLLAYRARNLEDEFTESKWIGVACASWIQVILIGIPVVLLTRTQPTAQYFTSTTLIFLICSSMLSLLFIPKMKMAARPPEMH